MAAKDIREKAYRAAQKAKDVKRDAPAKLLAIKNSGLADTVKNKEVIDKAADTMRPRMVSDTAKTAGRASAIANRETKKEEQSKKLAEAAKKSTEYLKAMGESKKGTQPGHHVTDSNNHTKPLSQSEKDFLAGQKYKEKIAKKTGVYPNTAN